MSEEELYAGLSVASELVQRGLLSKNRRAIIKELVLRWDGQVMEAIRKYGAGEELGQELGAAAEREIKSVITRVFSEMQAGASMHGRRQELMSFSSVALALQNIYFNPEKRIECFCIESGMGELSAALALLADFTRVFGVIPEMDAESDTLSSTLKPQDIVNKFNSTFYPMLDTSLSVHFDFDLAATDWRRYENNKFAKSDVIVVSLPNADSFDDFCQRSHKIQADAYLIVTSNSNVRSTSKGAEMLDEAFELLYTWESNEDGAFSVTYVYQRLPNNSDGTFVQRYTNVSDKKIRQGKSNAIDEGPKTPTRKTNNRKSAEYASSPIGASLMSRKWAFSNGDDKNIQTRSIGTYEAETRKFDPTVSSPIGDRLMSRKRMQSDQKLFPQESNSGRNITMQFSKPRRGWSEDSSASDLSADRDHNFTGENISSPLGSKLLQRKMQFSRVPGSSLSSASSSVSDDDNKLNNTILGDEVSRKSVDFGLNLNKTPPKSALSPLQRRLFMQGLSKKGGITSRDSEPAPSSPLGEALLLRRRGITSELNDDKPTLNFDVSSPQSSRLLRRKHQAALGNQNASKAGINFTIDSISSPKSTRLLARKHMISIGAKTAEAWVEDDK